MSRDGASRLIRNKHGFQYGITVSLKRLMEVEDVDWSVMVRKHLTKLYISSNLWGFLEESSWGFQAMP